MAEIATRGLEHSTIRGIAARANVATGTFYNHFECLNALLDELTEEFLDVVDHSRELTRAGEPVEFFLGVSAGRLCAFSVLDRPRATVFAMLVLASRISVPSLEIIDQMTAAQREAGIDPPRTDLVSSMIGAAIGTLILDIAARVDRIGTDDVAYVVEIFAAVLRLTPDQTDSARQIGIAEFEGIFHT